MNEYNKELNSEQKEFLARIFASLLYKQILITLSTKLDNLEEELKQYFLEKINEWNKDRFETMKDSTVLTWNFSISLDKKQMELLYKLLDCLFPTSSELDIYR